MEIVVVEDPEQVALRTARTIARIASEAIAERGLATLALSGGRTPLRMFDQLSRESIPWAQVHLFQTDERLTSRDHDARNARAIRLRLVERVPIPEARVHWMPVECEDTVAASRSYETVLRSVAGEPPELDVVHLGLGTDGHTASLFPNDGALETRDRYVVVTAEHAGWRRMTLTLPALERARHLVWEISGEAKRRARDALLAGDPAIPASRLPRSRSILISDRAAAGAHEGAHEDRGG